MTVAVDQQAQSYQKYVGQHPNSPLFARLAALYLEQGRNQEALKVCDEGYKSNGPIAVSDGEYSIEAVIKKR